MRRPAVALSALPIPSKVSLPATHPSQIGRKRVLSARGESSRRLNQTSSNQIGRTRLLLGRRALSPVRKMNSERASGPKDVLTRGGLFHLDPIGEKGTLGVEPTFP